MFVNGCQATIPGLFCSIFQGDALGSFNPGMSGFSESSRKQFKIRLMTILSRRHFKLESPEQHPKLFSTIAP